MNPLERQPAAAFARLIAQKVKRQENIPQWVPDELRGWLLSQKTRHPFHDRSKR